MPAPGEPHELRALVPFEIAAVIGLAIVPLPELMPVALPLFVVASMSRWARQRRWSEVLRADGWTTAVAVAAGLAALAVALIAGAPLVERITRGTVEWSVYPIVRGSAAQLFAVALVVVATAIAIELALRGWIVERMLELTPGPPVLPVLVGAIAEGLVTPGDAWVRIGAVVFGVGLGWIYVASGRSAIASIAARLAFALGAVMLEGLQLIG
jgi:hypothetical protein